MIELGKNTGVIIDPPAEGELFEGAIVPQVTNQSADWRQYECDGEWQKDMTVDFETEACMSFTPVNNVATYLNWLIQTNQIYPEQLQFLKDNGYIGQDGKVALSPRFTAKMDGTTINGNNFQRPWNSIKTNGVVPDSLWPMPVQEINANPNNAWALYYAPVPQSVIDMGVEFLKYFSIDWEWLVSDGNGASQQQFAAWLQVAPIHIAIAVCSPWNTASPIQGCGTGAAHGVQLSYVEVGGDNHILDHYAPFDKLLAPDYTLAYAVRGVVSQIRQPQSPVQVVQSVLPVVKQAAQQVQNVPVEHRGALETLLEEILQTLSSLLSTGG